MQTNLDLYVPLVYLLTAIPYAWLGLYAWRKRPAVAVTPFAWAMLGMSIWTFAYGLVIFFKDPQTKLLFLKVEYIGIVSVPVFLFMFALEFTGRGNILTSRNLILLWSAPVVTLLLIWTNQYHGLIWDNQSPTGSGGVLLLSVHHSFFYWVCIGYAYALALIAILLLLMEFIQRPGMYRVQASFVILGILSPVIGSLIRIFNSDAMQRLDLTPLFFIPTGLGLSWAITRYRLLDVLPMEHVSVLQNMKEGVIVVNPHQRILYLNPIIESLFGVKEANAIGQPIQHILGKYGEMIASYLAGMEHQFEVVLGEGRQAKVFDVTVSPVSSLHDSQAVDHPDQMITLHDITQRKEVELALSRRSDIMSAISIAAEEFLKETLWERNIPGVLEKIGRAVDVSRIFVVMNYRDENNILFSSLCYEWAASDIKSQINNPNLRHVAIQQAGFGRWEKRLSQG